MITHLEINTDIKQLNSRLGNAFKSEESGLIAHSFGTPTYRSKSEFIPIESKSSITVTRNPLMDKFWVEIKGSKSTHGLKSHGFLLQEGKTLLIKSGETTLSAFNSPIRTKLPEWVVDTNTKVRYLKQMVIGAFFYNFKLKNKTYQESVKLTNELLDLKEFESFNEIVSLAQKYSTPEDHSSNVRLIKDYYDDFLKPFDVYLEEIGSIGDEFVLIFAQLFRLANPKIERSDELFDQSHCNYIMNTMETDDRSFEILNTLIQNTFKIELVPGNNNRKFFSLKKVS